MTNSRRTAALLLLLAFALGAVAGAAGWALHDRPHRGRPGATHSRGPSGYLSKLTEELDLSQVQQDSVRAIFERYEPRMDSIWDETRPRFETLWTELRSDIDAQLTPEQQGRYARLLERMDPRRRTKDSTHAND